MLKRTIVSLLLIAVFAAPSFAASPNFAEAICSRQVHDQAGTAGVTPELRLPGQPPAPRNKQTCFQVCRDEYNQCLAGCWDAYCRTNCFYSYENCLDGCP